MTTRPPMTRASALGLGYGSVWLVTAGLAFGLLDVRTLNTTVGGTVLSLGGVVLVGGTLLVLCVRFLRRGSALPTTGAGMLSIRGRRLFGGLILLEIVGWTVLDVTLGRHHQEVWIVPLDLLLIGAHFIPLAVVFRVPAYLVMGVLWLVSIASSMVIWPSTMVIGRASAWATLPSVCCIAITWLTVVVVLRGATTRIRAADLRR